MQQFFYITGNVVLPLFIPVVLGYILNKLVEIDTKTLSALQFYILIPCLMYSKIMEADINAEGFVKVLSHCLVLYALLYLITFLIARLRGFDKRTTMAMINSVSLYNSGNYCLPLMDVLYQGNPLALTVQIIIMLTQNMLTNTFGIFTASYGTLSLKNALKQMLMLPMVYIAVIAVSMRYFHLILPLPVQYYVNSMGNALVPVALVTLGISLAQMDLDFKDIKIFIILLLRLIVSPLLAFGIAKTLGISGMVGQVLVISSAAPIAVNALLLSVQYNNRSDLVSKSIFASTALSAVTVSITIYFASNFI